MIEKRKMAVDYLYGLVLIEVLQQLHLHPGHDDKIQYIVNLSFKHFRYKDPFVYVESYLELLANGVCAFAARRWARTCTTRTRWRTCTPRCWAW